MPNPGSLSERSHTDTRESGLPVFMGAPVGVFGITLGGFARLYEPGIAGSLAVAGVKGAGIAPEITVAVLLGMGLAIAVLGPIWYWIGKPTFFRSVTQPRNTESTDERVEV